MSIELQKDAKPFNDRYYSTPRASEAPFKKEINQMCEVQVLRKLSHNDNISRVRKLEAN